MTTREHPLLLLIEDNRDTLVAAGRLFQALGFAVEIGRGGDEGIQKALADLPDVIVTDVAMPHTSGCDVCERLHADPSTRDVPIIAYTGLVDVTTLASLVRVGVRVIAVKPCSPSAIAAEARRLMSSGPSDDEEVRVVTDEGELLADLAAQIAAQAHQLTT